MGLVADLETQKLLKRARENIAVGDAGGPEVHPNNAGPGLVASGAMGPERRKQFLHDYPELVRMAELAVAAGYRTTRHELPATLGDTGGGPSAA